MIVQLWDKKEVSNLLNSNSNNKDKYKNQNGNLNQDSTAISLLDKINILIVNKHTRKIKKDTKSITITNNNK